MDLSPGASWALIALASVAMVSVAAAAYGRWRWRVAAAAIRARLDAARQPPPVSRYSHSELAGLPAPVQRYLRLVLTEGHPVVVAASLTQAGSFNMSADGEQWRPFTASQRVTTHPPGFDWDARIGLVPGVAVHVHDAYIAGQALLHGAVLGLVPVVDVQGTVELARGELMRYLAEAAWYPTALLPSQGVRWTHVDDTSAQATLVDGEVAATLLFRFSPGGLIETVYSAGRDRLVAGRNTRVPWEGRFWNPAVRGGMTVPLNSEVAWMLPQGRKTYFRAVTTSLDHEFAA